MESLAVAALIEKFFIQRYAPDVMLQNDNRMILSEMNARELQKSVNSDTVAVLIFGACENHGEHMPFGSDFIMPYELAKRVASKSRNLLILPPVQYGVSSHHKDFAMTMSLEPETMIRVVYDILESLIANKINRILIINGHDGNIAPIELASRSAKEKHPTVVISCLESWWSLVGELEPKLFDVWKGLGHGGEAETSAMLAVRPELVHMKLAPDELVPNLPDHVRIYWKFSELTDTGATGAPRMASADKGERLIALLEKILIEFIEKMARENWMYGRNRL